MSLSLQFYDPAMLRDYCKSSYAARCCAKIVMDDYKVTYG